jgi:hypothetical protein
MEVQVVSQSTQPISSNEHASSRKFSILERDCNLFVVLVKVMQLLPELEHAGKTTCQDPTQNAAIDTPDITSASNSRRLPAFEQRVPTLGGRGV